MGPKIDPPFLKVTKPPKTEISQFFLANSTLEIQKRLEIQKIDIKGNFSKIFQKYLKKLGPNLDPLFFEIFNFFQKPIISSQFLYLCFI